MFLTCNNVDITALTFTWRTMGVECRRRGRAKVLPPSLFSTHNCFADCPGVDYVTTPWNTTPGLPVSLPPGYLPSSPSSAPVGLRPRPCRRSRPRPRPCPPAFADLPTPSFIGLEALLCDCFPPWNHGAPCSTCRLSTVCRWKP
jgi:hypothetical protein